MFGKKPQSESNKSEKATQSQSLSDVTITGGALQMGQAGGDLQQSQVTDQQTDQQVITATEVVKQLEQLESAVNQSALTDAQKGALLPYLSVAKQEAAKDSPNKSLVEQTLKPVSETLKTLNETSEAGKSLWKTGVAVFKVVAPWIGVALSVFGV